MKIYSCLTVCPQCDGVYRRRPYTANRTALCKRCQAVLWRSDGAGIARILPLSLAAAITFFIACVCPVMSVSFHGIHNEVTLWQAAWPPSLGQRFPLLALCTAFLLIFAPALQITLTIWLLLFARYRRRAPGFAMWMKTLLWLRPWSMIEVGVLGFLVAAVKLSSLLDVAPGPGGWALAVSLVLIVIITHHDLRPLWAIEPPRRAGAQAGDEPDAGETQICGCDVCGLVSALPTNDGDSRCPRCASRLTRHRPPGDARSWALLSAAVIFYIPANVLPVMYTSLFGRGSESTIMAGVIEFWRGGSYGIAAIIFIASVVIPCMKFLALGLLLITTRRHSGWARRERTRLYRITEWIGSWSMLDVVVVAVISALVQFHALSEAEPRAGIVFFALVVILTMLSALSFDPRRIWEGDK
ncbi:paraquat-inducible membrane protein A [Affinibrenneria salicis]|uniref:Paraquat-inducible membrane protein A n=1 Tax=Affinibrenneria salicis TaxID=2590031 RepID=A0A5J5G3E0_9GAMM|nr:paraquat-inducible membrane protein A [Affinibrenneria salicis]